MKTVILTKDQFSAIIAAVGECVAQGVQLAIEQLILVGLTYELCLFLWQIRLLRVCDVDLEKQTIRVHRSGGSRPDRLPFPDWMLAPLSAWVALRRSVAPDAAAEQPLIVVGDFNTLASNAVRMCGVSCNRGGFSVLRNSGIARKFQDGWKLPRIADYLGVERVWNVNRLLTSLGVHRQNVVKIDQNKPEFEAPGHPDYLSTWLDIETQKQAKI